MDFIMDTNRWVFYGFIHLHADRIRLHKHTNTHSRIHCILKCYRIDSCRCIVKRTLKIKIRSFIAGNGISFSVSNLILDYIFAALKCIFA